MAIATLGTQLPGEDYSYQQFEYTPAPQVQQQAPLEMPSFDQRPTRPMGPVPFWSSPQEYYPEYFQGGGRRGRDGEVDSARSAAEMAIRYQGLRGYQNALKEGKSAKEAMEQFGPMLLWSDPRAIGANIKALTQPSYTWDEKNQAFTAPGARPFFRPGGQGLRPDLENPERNVVTLGGVKGYINPRTGAFTKLEDSTKLSPLDMQDYRMATKQLSEANKVLMNQYADPKTKDEARAVIKSVQEKIDTIRSKQEKPSTEQSAVPSEKPKSAVPSIGEVRRGYRFKGGSPAIADNWEKVL